MLPRTPATRYSRARRSRDTQIAKSCGRVMVETLNMSGMVRNRRLSRAIADAGMAGFQAKLEYKCTWYGAEFVKADR